MDVAPHWLEGKIVKLEKKQVVDKDWFTPACVISEIPLKTVYTLPTYCSHPKVN